MGATAAVVVLRFIQIAHAKGQPQPVPKPANKQLSVLEKFYDVWGMGVTDEQRTAMMQSLDNSRTQARAAINAAQMSSAARH